MEVLTLTNSADAPFMTQQMAAAEERGISFTTCVVPGTVDGSSARSPFDYLRYVPRVVSEVGNGYDVVHAHYGLTGPVALTHLRTPTVLSLWGSDLYGPVEPISRLTARHCEEVIVMSEAMAERLGEECVVIPDGVDLSLFQPAPQSTARAAVGWNDDPYYVLFPYAPTRSVKDYPRARRVVNAVSDRLDRPVILETVFDVDHTAIPDYMNAADALLVTSKSEGSPNSVKEAMACNLPVVSTDVGDVATRLAEVTPSTVAKTDRELIDELADILEAETRSDGHEAAAEVSLARSTDALVALYRRAIERA